MESSVVVDSESDSSSLLSGCCDGCGQTIIFLGSSGSSQDADNGSLGGLSRGVVNDVEQFMLMDCFCCVHISQASKQARKQKGFIQYSRVVVCCDNASK